MTWTRDWLRWPHHDADVYRDQYELVLRRESGHPNDIWHRGKIERLFGKLTTELLPSLPGHIPPGNNGKPVTTPTLSVSELDAAVGEFIIDDYLRQEHPETEQPPIQRWLGQGWLPRMPGSVEQLNLLLMTQYVPHN